MEVFATKDVWDSYTEKELAKYKGKVFRHYRKNGFPYFPEDHDWRSNELSVMKRYDFTRCIDTENKLIKQSMHGLALCWSYHPHHYGIKCNNQRTVAEVFNDDDLFKSVIDKCLKHSPRMTDNTIRKKLKIYCGAQCVSNFRPTAAAAIYSHFCKEGDYVFDMSAGFGGRCLGAHLAGVKYFGVDPSTKTQSGVKQMIEDLGLDAGVKCQGSEERVPLPDNYIDFCFTSPPYYDCEKYADEDTQSFIKFPTQREWLNLFFRRTLRNCQRLLKPNKHLVINVADVKSYVGLVDDIIELAEYVGFKHVDTWGLHLSNMTNGGFKTEPILVFKNCKVKVSRKQLKRRLVHFAETYSLQKTK